METNIDASAPEVSVVGETATPAQQWKSRIARTKRLRRDLLQDWSLNVDYRRGKPFQDDSDTDRIQVTIDWSATKAKQAQLFSQVPEVRLTHKSEPYKAAAPVFAKKLNDLLCLSRVGTAMDEVLPDCINAAGVGAVLVSYETLTEKRDVPTVPPEVAAQMQAQGMKVETKSVDVVVDSRFPIRRISPADLLWEVSFTGSDFDDGPWIGNSGRMPWAPALQQFGKSEKNPNGLTEADKKQVVGGDRRTSIDVLAGDDMQLRFKETDQVEYDQIFYRRHLFHEDETNFSAIQRMVFVHGKDEPVIDELWTGQQRDEETGKLFGARCFPIQVLTLTYLSDESIPPSDSAMGRPQVNELNRSRTQMTRQREGSTPLRWFDVNRVDTGVQTQLMRGTWQGMIPMNGPGDRAIGEVARANYPVEDNAFDNIAKADLRQTWQIEDTVGDGPAIRSAEEARNRQGNFQTRIGYERARCAKFFIRIAEVAAGLLSLYGTWTDEEKQRLGDLDPRMLSDYYSFNVRADSTLLLDSNQRVERLMRFLNMTAKSGVVDVLPVIAEIAELEGLDPGIVIKPLPEKGPEPLSTSLRLSGAADLHDPFVVAMLLHSQQMPTEEELNQAKIFIASLQLQPTPPAPPPPGGPEGGPGGPGGPPPPPLGGPGGPPRGAGGPPAPSSRPSGPPAAASQVPPSAAGGAMRRQPPYQAHPSWNTVNRVEKRAEDGK